MCIRDRAWADVAITAGGTTCWELAFMGVPFVGLSRAKQEAILLQETTRIGMSLNMGEHQNLEPCDISEVLMRLIKDKRQRSTTISIGSVSYTHLDVYKRQSLRSH